MSCVQKETEKLCLKNNSGKVDFQQYKAKEQKVNYIQQAKKKDFKNIMDDTNVETRQLRTFPFEKRNHNSYE